MNRQKSVDTHSSHGSCFLLCLDVQVPKGLMDFAAFARASQGNTPDVASGDKLKIGDMTYTVEDIPQKD